MRQPPPPPLDDINVHSSDASTIRVVPKAKRKQALDPKTRLLYKKTLNLAQSNCPEPEFSKPYGRPIN